MEVVSQALIIDFVQIGLGLGFAIIDLALKTYPNLQELKINNELPKLNIYLATNKNLNLTFAAKTFIDFI